MFSNESSRTVCLGMNYTERWSEASPLVEYPSEVIVGSVVGHGLGVQGPVDGWLPSLHGQTIQLHRGGDAAWETERWRKKTSED